MGHRFALREPPPPHRNAGEHQRLVAASLAGRTEKIPYKDDDEAEEIMQRHL
jgi:hypothetical protein